MSQINLTPVSDTSIQTPTTGKKAFYLDSTTGKGTLMDENRNKSGFSSSLLNGNSNPASNIGEEGDFYINMTTKTMFGPKTGTSWGSGFSIVGPQGPQGNTGATGPQGNTGAIGPQGVQGPAGPVALIYKNITTGASTLPDTTAWSAVSLNDINFTSGQYVATCTIAISPHSNGNDVRFQWKLDGVDVGPRYSEEHKDVSAAQQNIRSWQFDLGTQPTGLKYLDLYFQKEATGGVAILQFISIFVWRIG